MSRRLELLLPSVEFAQSYRSYIAELTARGEPFIPFCLEFPHEDFSALVSRLHDMSQGIGVPDIYPPSTTFWLVDERGEIIAVSNLRHYLTPAITNRHGHIGYGVRPSTRRNGYGRTVLEFTLLRAKERGLKQIMITCAEDNLGSIGVILGNGGIFDSVTTDEETQERFHRYFIDIR